MTDHARISALHPHEVRRLSDAGLRLIAADEPVYLDPRRHHAQSTVDDAQKVLALRIVARPEAKGGHHGLRRRAWFDDDLRAAMLIAGTRRQRRAAAHTLGRLRRAGAAKFTPAWAPAGF